MQTNKINPKLKVSCIILLDTIITNLNKQVNNELNKHYTYKFKQGKSKNPLPTKKGLKHYYNTLIVHVSDLKTNKRVILFEEHYVFENPSERLTKDWKRSLIELFLYTSMGFFLINKEAHVEEQLIKEAVKQNIKLDANRRDS